MCNNIINIVIIRDPPLGGAALLLVIIIATPEAIARVFPDCPHCDLKHGAYQVSLLGLSVLYLGEHPLLLLLVVVSVKRLDTATGHARGPAAKYKGALHQG